jgi:hypothetical protein
MYTVTQPHLASTHNNLRRHARASMHPAVLSQGGASGIMPHVACRTLTLVPRAFDPSPCPAPASHSRVLLMPATSLRAPRAEPCLGYTPRRTELVDEMNCCECEVALAVWLPAPATS